MNNSAANNADSAPLEQRSGARWIAGRTLSRLRSCGGRLALADAAFKVFAFVVLSPILAIAFRLFVEFSGLPRSSD